MKSLFTAVFVILAVFLPRAQFVHGEPEPERERVPAGAVGMLAQLEDDDWILQSQALTYLAKHRVPSAAGPIRRLLESSSTPTWVRSRALVASSMIAISVSDESTARDVIDRFAKHTEPQLRAAAARASENLPETVSGPILASLLEDKIHVVRYSALAAYARRHRGEAWALVDQQTRSLELADYEAGARALAFVGNDAALARLRTFSNEPQGQSALLRGIRDVRDAKLLPLLLRMTARAANDAVASSLISALQTFRRVDLVAALGAVLKDGDEAMIRSAAQVITRLAPAPELGEPLGRAIATVRETATIYAVLVALGSRALHPDAHHRVFAAYLDHDDAEIRATAIRCLARCTQPDLYALLRERVNDTSVLVTRTALRALLDAPADRAPGGQLVAYLEKRLEADDDVTRELASRLLGYAGTAADFQPALALLGERLRSKDNERRIHAADVLGKIAPESKIASVVSAQGYLSSWRVLGTFLNDQKNSAFDREFPPEKEIDFSATYTAKYVWWENGGAVGGQIEREIQWARGVVDRADGKLLAAPVLPPPGSWVVAYAVADVFSDAEREARMTIDGDDAFRVWLNGVKIAEAVGKYQRRQPCVVEKANITVRLQPGANRFLVKTTNIDHDWWFRVRLTDAEGFPIEELRQ